MTTATATNEPIAGAPAGPAIAALGIARRQRRAVVLIAVAVVALLAAIAWWMAHRGLESTDNAQIDGEVVAVPSRAAGMIAQVLFIENQSVKAGDVLAVLDDEQAKARLAQAEANLAAADAAAEAADADAQVAETNATGNKSVAEASLQTASVGAATAVDQIKEADAAVRSAEVAFHQAEADRERSKQLLSQGAISNASFDQAETAYNLANANLEAARARRSTLGSSATAARSRIVEASAKVKQTSNVVVLVSQARARAKAAQAQVSIARAARDLAKLDLSYTRILAPADGFASKKTITIGQTVSPGQAIAQIVTPAVWVTANFKETQVARMHAGQHAHFSADAFPGIELAGEVESVSGATGSRFSLLPPDNASGNFTKVVQRIPVRIRLHDPPPGVTLRPGMSVELTVDTRS